MKNYTITATPNHRERTFTIRKKQNGRTVFKYRTLPMTQTEFDDSTLNTESDWQNFLTRNSGEYCTIKN